MILVKAGRRILHESQIHLVEPAVHHPFHQVRGEMDRVDWHDFGFTSSCAPKVYSNFCPNWQILLTLGESNV